MFYILIFYSSDRGVGVVALSSHLSVESLSHFITFLFAAPRKSRDGHRPAPAVTPRPPLFVFDFNL